MAQTALYVVVLLLPLIFPVDWFYYFKLNAFLLDPWGWFLALPEQKLKDFSCNTWMLQFVNLLVSLEFCIKAALIMQGTQAIFCKVRFMPGSRFHTKKFMRSTPVR